MAQNLIISSHTFTSADTWEDIGIIDPDKNHHINAFFGDIEMNDSLDFWFRGIIDLDSSDQGYPFPVEQLLGKTSRLFIGEKKITEFLKSDGSKSSTEGKFTVPINIGNVVPILRIQCKVVTLGVSAAVINSLKYTKGYAG